MADSPESTSSDLGGLEIPPISSTPTDGTGATSPLSASAQHVQQRKRRSDAGQPRGPRGAKHADSVSPLSQLQFAKLYSPEVWGRTLAAPGTTLAFVTGKKLWEISSEEREAMGQTGSIAAQCFAVSDPRWLALAICAITVLEVYGTRAALYMAQVNREREEAKKKKE